MFQTRYIFGAPCTLYQCLRRAVRIFANGVGNEYAKMQPLPPPILKHRKEMPCSHQSTSRAPVSTPFPSTVARHS